MNGKGKNIDPKRKVADMIEYWNFSLNDEVVTYTRQKYSWLDTCAFVGGNVDFLLMLVGVFFFAYNYEVPKYSMHYQYHKMRALETGKKTNDQVKKMEKNLNFLSLKLFLLEFKRTFQCLFPCLKCCQRNYKQPLSFFDELEELSN